MSAGGSGWRSGLRVRHTQAMPDARAEGADARRPPSRQRRQSGRRLEIADRVAAGPPRRADQPSGRTTMPAAIAEPTASLAPRTSSRVQSCDRTTLTEAPSHSPSARRRQASTSPQRTSSTVAREPATQAESGHAAGLSFDTGRGDVVFWRESSFSTLVRRELRTILKWWRKSTQPGACGQQRLPGRRPRPSEVPRCNPLPRSLVETADPCFPPATP